MSRRGATFASKLYEMVEEATDAGYVQWNAGGEFVVVTQLPQFCRLLTTYFKTTSFASFSRQLLLYGALLAVVRAGAGAERVARLWRGGLEAEE